MKVLFRALLSHRWGRRLLWAVGLVLCYTVVGFLVLPPIFRAVAANQLTKQLDRKVTIQKVKLNPYVLSATIRGLLIADKDSEPFLSWDEVYANLQLVSFFGHPWVFKEVKTTRPYVRVQVNKDGSLNFSDLLTKFSATNAAPQKPSKPLSLQIEQVQVLGASASLADLTVRTPFKRIVGPLDVTLKNFHTDPGSKNPYSFSGTTDAGEKFAWSGFFYLDPIQSQGSFSLEGITLPKYAPLYQDLVRFDIQDGVINLQSTYRFSLAGTNLEAAVTNTSFTLRSFKLAQSGAAASTVELPELAVRGVSVDLETRQAEVASVSATGARLAVSRGKDNTINLIELSKPAATATNAPGSILLLLQSVTNIVHLLLSSTNAWTAAVHDIDVRDCALNLEDLAAPRPVHLNLDQVALTAKNLSNLPGTNLTASLALRWNTNGTFKTGVTASFAPILADIDLSANRLELAPLDPYLATKVDAFLLGSKLSLDGHIRMAVSNTALPEVTFKGDARLDDFSTVDAFLAEQLLQWGSVRLSGLEAVLNPPSVAIRQIDVDDLAARVIIETNRTVNLLAALRLASTNTAPAAPSPPESTPAKGKARKSALAVAADSVSAKAAGPVEGLPRVNVSLVVVSNAQVRFVDRSVTPAVNLSVQQAGGTIRGISTEQLQHADLDLKARVDNIGPIEITGLINPLNQDQTNDLKITARNVDLTPTSPYVGKFAGYRLAQGRLGADLAYHLVGRTLKSENVVTLDRFTFGDKVNSPDATKLPVKLGIALLKDRQGQIKLDLPIEGSLDDPQFRIGKVVIRVIENILVKVATSPFSLLGSLLGGKGEELRYQDFTPGSAVVPVAGREKLDSLLKAFYERPGLQLEIEGSVDPAPDREALRRQSVEARLRARKWMSLGDSEKAATRPNEIAFTPEERSKWIKRAYAEALEKGEIHLPSTNAPAAGEAAAAEGTNAPMTAPPILALPQPPAPAPDRGATALLQFQKAKPVYVTRPATTAAVAGAAAGTASARPKTAGESEVEIMEQLLLDTVQVSESDLLALAADRAKAVREYLAQSGKVEPERLFLAEKQAGAAVKVEGSRVYLQLQ